MRSFSFRMHRNSSRYLICYVQSILRHLNVFPSMGKGCPSHKQNVQAISQCKMKSSRFGSLWNVLLARQLYLTFIRKSPKPILWSCQVCYAPSVCAFSFALETSYYYVCPWIVGTNISLLCPLWHQLCHYCDNYAFAQFIWWGPFWLWQHRY